MICILCTTATMPAFGEVLFQLKPEIKKKLNWSEDQLRSLPLTNQDLVIIKAIYPQYDEKSRNIGDGNKLIVTILTKPLPNDPTKIGVIVYLKSEDKLGGEFILIKREDDKKLSIVGRFASPLERRGKDGFSLSFEFEGNNLNSDETAIGFRERVRYWGSHDYSEEVRLRLYRIEPTGLSEILSILVEDKDIRGGCKSTLSVEKAQTLGFYDWKVELPGHTQPAIYRWTGKYYEAINAPNWGLLLEKCHQKEDNNT